MSYIQIHHDTEAPHHTVSGDLREPGTGFEDDANYEARDALEKWFPSVEFDPETSCFFAYAPSSVMADELYAAVNVWVETRRNPSTGAASEWDWVADLLEDHWSESTPVMIETMQGMGAPLPLIEAFERRLEK